eukprot:scaffold83445_cov21-Tisochrysis_lutea.AAC.3
MACLWLFPVLLGQGERWRETSKTRAVVGWSKHRTLPPLPEPLCYHQPTHVCSHHQGQMQAKHNMLPVPFPFRASKLHNSTTVRETVAKLCSSCMPTTIAGCLDDVSMIIAGEGRSPGWVGLQPVGINFSTAQYGSGKKQGCHEEDGTQQQYWREARNASTKCPDFQGRNRYARTQLHSTRLRLKHCHQATMLGAHPTGQQSDVCV